MLVGVGWGVVSREGWDERISKGLYECGEKEGVIKRGFWVEKGVKNVCGGEGGKMRTVEVVVLLDSRLFFRCVDRCPCFYFFSCHLLLPSLCFPKELHSSFS